jgi:hypothetical protein
MTLNLVLRARSEGAAITCAEIARRWLAVSGSGALSEKHGPLDLIRHENIDRIETNLQIAHAPKSVIRDFRTDYLLKVFRYDGTAGIFAEAPMENQIDRARLLADDGLKQDFRAWLLDPANLAATRFRNVGTVHAVDDAGQHEPRLLRVEQRAVEQLKIKTRTDADRFLRQICRVPCDVAIELAIDRLPDRRHRWQGKQGGIGEPTVRLPLGQQHAIETESSAVEFAQRRGIGDRRAAFQRGILRRPCRPSAA